MANELSTELKQQLTNDILDQLAQSEGERMAISYLHKKLTSRLWGKGWSRLGRLSEFDQLVESLGFTVTSEGKCDPRSGVFVTFRRYVTL